jgi:hypothetical protein
MTSGSSPCSVAMTSDLSLRSRQIYPRNHLATSRAILGQANPDCPHFLLPTPLPPQAVSPAAGCQNDHLKTKYQALVPGISPRHGLHVLVTSLWSAFICR